MSSNRDRIDQDIAEQLLHGARDRQLRSSHPLAGRLAAAAAPPLPGELAGEHEALAAFGAAAHLDFALQPGRRSMIKTALAKLVTVKVVAIIAAASAGGVALAASTGALPGPFDHVPAGVPTSAHATAESTAGPAGANATPSPSLIGLCHAYLAGAGADHGKALDNPAFTVLITTAGGRDKVDAYCTSLPTTAPDNSPTTHPTRPPTSHPTGAPTRTHPTGEPSTAHPTGAPTTHPTGAPTTHSAR